MVAYISSLIVAVINFGMALLQISLTFGAPLGEFVLGGNYKVLPANMRFVSMSFAVIFIIIGLAYLQFGNIINIGYNDIIVNILVIINILFLAYAIVANGFITKSIMEKAVMTPISIFQFVVSIVSLISVHKSK